MVLDHLIREADMDGLVTVLQREIGDAVGVTVSVAGDHVARLAADGLLTVVGKVGPSNTIQAIQLSESLL